jgi:hypothetical protein
MKIILFHSLQLTDRNYDLAQKYLFVSFTDLFKDNMLQNQLRWSYDNGEVMYVIT